MSDIGAACDGVVVFGLGAGCDGEVVFDLGA